MLFSTVYFNCGTGTDKADQDSSNAGTKKAAANSYTGWVPPSSRLGRDGNTLHVKAPEGWHYIAYNGKAKVAYGSGDFTISISCPCNMGNPVSLKSSAAPAGTALTCSGENCRFHHTLELQDEHLLTSDGGYFQPEAPLRILKPGDRAPAVFDALLLEFPVFKEQLSRFLAKAHYGTPMALPVKKPDGSITAPAGYVLIAISLMGRGLITVIPEDVAKAQKGYIKIVKAFCPYKGSSLKIHQVLGTGIMWSSGTRSVICSLNTGNSPGENAGAKDPEAITITSYQY